MIKQTSKGILTNLIVIAMIIFSSFLLPQTVFAQETSICNQPIETGSCRGGFNRYAFNGSQCTPFSFGGCEGNENNFIT